MTKRKWRCPQCRIRARIDPRGFPVRCVCGYTADSFTTGRPGQRSPSAASEASAIPCIHRSAAATGAVDCRLCGNPRTIAVYDCALHGTCTLSTVDRPSKAEHAYCPTCPDRQSGVGFQPATRERSDRPLRIFQWCPSLGTACGVANFAANLHVAGEHAGSTITTAAELPNPGTLAEFDVLLIQHEHALFRSLSVPPSLRPSVLFAHSPRVNLDAAGYITMAPGMVRTRRPVYVMPHPGRARPLEDRDVLRRRLGLDRFRLLIGSHGFTTPARRFAEIVDALAPRLRPLGGGLVLAAASHARQSRDAGLQRAAVELEAAAARHADVVHLERGFLPHDDVNARMQACDLTWCWTRAPSRPYASGVASDLYAAGTRLVVADKLQHRAVLGRPNVIAAPADFESFLAVLDEEIRIAATTEINIGEPVPRHDPSELDWPAQIGPLLAFLCNLKSEI